VTVAPDRCTGRRRPVPPGPERHRALLQHTSVGFVLFDRHGRMIEAVPGSPPIPGYDAEQVMATPTTELVHPDDLGRWQEAWSAVIAEPEGQVAVTLRARHVGGRWHQVEVTIVNALDDPSVGGVVATVVRTDGGPKLDRPDGWSEVSRARSDGPLEDRPLEDGPLEEGRFEGGHAGDAGGGHAGDAGGGHARDAHPHGPIDDSSTRRPGEVRPLVLMAKLDQLYLVIQACGRAAADELLVSVAERLRSVLRAGEELDLLDQDRFVVTCERQGGRRAAKALARRFARGLAESFKVGDDYLILTASIGVAVGTTVDADVRALLVESDLAMAASATAGGNRWSLSTKEGRSEALEQVRLPGALRRALVEEQFVVHYQPVVDLETGDLVGTEALVRWAQAGGDLILPQRYLSAAESSGIIVALGTWVLREACGSAARWLATLGASPYVAVNLATRQLEDPDLPAIVKDVLTDTGLEPGRLLLEITEGVLIRDLRAVTSRLQELRKMGVRVAVDDFGTGYSSLAYLKRLPVDVLKIDRSFVAGLGRDQGDAAIVAAIITLGRSLGLGVVAEGVETRTQANELRRLGCAYGQGFLYGRPGPADRVRGLFPEERPPRQAQPRQPPRHPALPRPALPRQAPR
jgi:PAS domain S-box-containing protein